MTTTTERDSFAVDTTRRDEQVDKLLKDPDEYFAKARQHAEEVAHRERIEDLRHGRPMR